MSLAAKIIALREEIESIESELSKKRTELFELESLTEISEQSKSISTITKYSPSNEKVHVFMSLFRGRNDVYALRFESFKSGKTGYQPVCGNEWIQGVCNKPKVKCSDCSYRKFLAFNEEVVKCHLLGEESLRNGSKPFIAGIYPLLVDDTCFFLAIDFDKSSWVQDAKAFMETCSKENIPAYLERSRSGNGAHIWIFFDEKITARTARNLGSLLMTKTLDRRPEIGLDSFDRFFPNQDTMPKGGLGNLIALPLQKRAREKNHSVFLDETMQPYADQWAFLASVEKLEKVIIENLVQNAQLHQEILPVAHTEAIQDDDEPWKVHSKKQWPAIEGVIPQKIGIVVANQIFIDSTGLPPLLRNRILRLASFSNPEFYQAQALRLPTWGKPRILYCYQQFPQHIAIPIGCLDELNQLLLNYKIKPIVQDKRSVGVKLDVSFSGILYSEQMDAAQALLREENGILSATTAFGKTVVALWLIAQRKVNTLILVHRTQLLDQWVERIVQFLGGNKKSIGRIGGGRKKRTGQIDVALIQSVSRKGVVEDWVGEYGQVIVDECHHISAYSFEQVIRSSSAKYKVGLSATLTRKDGQHPIVLMNLGPVRYTVSAKKQAAERSFEHFVKMRLTDFMFEQVGLVPIAIQDVFSRLWENELRNRLIVRDVLEAMKSSRRILVLSERTEHLELFRQMLSDHVEYLYILKGGLGKKQLKSIMADLSGIDKSKSFVILATGRYLGEGFDLPNLDTLFLTFPVSWSGTLAQYAGRLHRECQGKTEVVIYDYVDELVPMLSRMHKKRLTGYATLGYVVKD